MDIEYLLKANNPDFNELITIQKEAFPSWYPEYSGGITSFENNSTALATINSTPVTYIQYLKRDDKDFDEYWKDIEADLSWRDHIIEGGKDIEELLEHHIDCCRELQLEVPYRFTPIGTNKITLKIHSTAFIVESATHPIYQGKGIKTTLSNLLLDSFCQQGITDVFTNIRDNNFVNRHIAEQQGFVPILEEPHFGISEQFMLVYHLKI